MASYDSICVCVCVCVCEFISLQCVWERGGVLFWDTVIDQPYILDSTVMHEGYSDNKKMSAFSSVSQQCGYLLACFRYSPYKYTLDLVCR